MECLSAKTLSGRLFQNSTTNKITMSAPLVFSSKQIQTKAMASTYSFTKEDVSLQFHSPGSYLTCLIYLILSSIYHNIF